MTIEAHPETEKNWRSETSTVILNMSIFTTNFTICPKNFCFLTFSWKMSFSRNDEILGVINHLIFNWTPTVCNNILSRHFFFSLEKCFTCCDIPAPPYDATFLCQYVLSQLLFYIFIIKDGKLWKINLINHFIFLSLKDRKTFPPQWHHLYQKNWRCNKFFFFNHFILNNCFKLNCCDNIIYYIVSVVKHLVIFNAFVHFVVNVYW